MSWHILLWLVLLPIIVGLVGTLLTRHSGDDNLSKSLGSAVTFFAVVFTMAIELGIVLTYVIIHFIRKGW